MLQKAAAEILRIDPEFSIERNGQALSPNWKIALQNAGLKGKLLGSYKILEENRLSGEEIKKLLFGHTITGFQPKTGIQWYVKWDQDGKKNKFWI